MLLTTTSSTTNKMEELPITTVRQSATCCMVTYSICHFYLWPLYIDVALTEAEIPLLISTEQLAKWRVRIDFGRGTLEFRDSGEVIALEKMQGSHYVLPIMRRDKVFENIRSMEE